MPAIIRTGSLYRPRFVTQQQLDAMLECFRRTRCGNVNWRPTKHERTLRAIEMAAEEGSIPAGLPGAYKDLSCALEGCP